MFGEEIRQTPLTGNLADTVFTNINGNPYRNDVTFLATLRYMLYGRMPENESVYVCSYRVNTNPQRLRKATAKEDMENMFGMSIDEAESGLLRINYLDMYNQTDKDSVMEFVASNFTECFTGWHRMQKITDLFKSKKSPSNSLNVMCFYNAAKKSSILLVEQMDTRIYHLLQQTVVGILPWYFDPKKEDLKPLIGFASSLGEKTSDNYMNYLAEFAKQFDFRSAKIRASMHGFENVALKGRLEGVRRNIDRIMRDINDYKNAISRLMREKYDYDIQFTGIQAKMASDECEDELMNYFLSNQRLVLEEIRGSVMTFGVRTYLEFFDEDSLKILLNNRSSMVYSAASGSITGDDVRDLLTAIFIDGKLKIRTCAAYWLDLTGGFDAKGHYSYGSEYNGYLPNPHIDEYNCIGNYSEVMSRCMEHHDYVMTVEQCIASAKSLNFNDSPVMTRFMGKMYNYNGSTGFIEAPDGQIMKPVEAVAWLKANSVEE